MGSSLGLCGLNSPWALVMESGFLAAIFDCMCDLFLLEQVKSELESDDLVLLGRLKSVQIRQSF